MADRPFVLVVCTGNSARSQMAEALLAARDGDRIDVGSAGTEPAAEVHPFAVKVMAERGLDISGRRPKSIGQARELRGNRPIDLAVTVCDGARQVCPHVPGARATVHVGFQDPAAARGDDARRLAVFRRVAGEIEARLDEMLAALPGD